MTKNTQWTVFIFGMSGDLAKRKLIPALYKLFKAGHTLNIIGLGYETLTIETIIDNSKKFIKDADNKTLQDFMALCSYYQADFNDQQNFVDTLKKIENQENIADHRLAYMSVATDYFCTITKALTTAGLIKKGDKQHRVVYEKPFGHDQESAKEINNYIGKLLEQYQIYRVDHYLTKAMINNIILMRFSNIIFEPIWNHKYVDNVEIILDESICIEGRGKFYDKYGAVRDVVQNHMLQMLALTAMEEPKCIQEKDVVEAKVKALKQVKIQEVVFGQYDGYQEEPTVKSNSETETFFACKLTVDNDRWRDVPFYMRTGKCINKKVTAIIITFKKIENCLTRAGTKLDQNVLTIAMAPREGFQLSLNAKKPHSAYEVTNARMDFCYECLFGTETSQAYVELLLSIFSGDRSITVSPGEIDAQWAITDQITSLKRTVLPYKKNSLGPEAALKLLPKRPQSTLLN